MKSTSTPSTTHDEIARRARQIWEETGHPDGQEIEHWLQAERELNQPRQASPQAPVRADSTNGSNKPGRVQNGRGQARAGNA